ncbi:MAG: NAD-dependent epimerase/dehydratase family protein [Beijerinckiaceae bacterium]
MKVVITGNMGYVGPVLVRHLRKLYPNAELVGYDMGLFAHCLTTREEFPERLLSRQIFGDVRDITPDLFEGADAVVQLAAISNDPMGNRFEKPTGEINHRSSVAVAEMAKAAGVKNYVFASSCSVYGAAEGGPRKETDALNPLTAYARSKIDTEQSLAQLDNDAMTVTCLRFATACGWSDRLRLDLVLNDFAACAVATGRIEILSDGTPWRPLIDVADMARAIDWAIGRDESSGGRMLAVNTGSDQWNYQVKQLADAAAEIFPGTSVSVNPQAQPDKRSYSVDFSLFRQLAPEHQPQTTLAQSLERLRKGLTDIDFADANFRESQLIRLKVLDNHMRAGRLSPDIRWTAHERGA